MDRLPLLPPIVKDAVAQLLDAGLDVHVVGGALRDTLLGRQVRDFDLVVAADLETAQRALPRAIAVSARTPVLLIRARPDSPRVEITALHGLALSLEADLRQRDFTINAIAFDPRRALYIDPLGGRADLSARILRAVDPDRVFQADPVRILRGVRLAHELELKLDPQTTRALELNAWRLHEAAGERLRDELLRILESPVPSLAIERLHAIGALGLLLPELLREVGIGQNRHHREDVFRHTLRVCDAVRPDPVLRLAALLHDAGKPESKRLNTRTGDFSFREHEHLGVAHVQRVAKRLCLSRRTRARIENLVRHHLLFPEHLQSDASLRRLLRRVGRDPLPDLLELRRADLASRNESGTVPDAWERLERRIHALAYGPAGGSATPLAISGREIMRELQVPEGPEVGHWLQAAEHHILDHPEENERARILSWLREVRDQEAH